MLSLLFILFVARAFYFMAEHYHRNKWGYAVVGLISFYVGVIPVTLAFIGAGVKDPLLISVASVPVGIVTCRLTYVYLRKQWRETPVVPRDRTSLDSDLMALGKDSNKVK